MSAHLYTGIVGTRGGRVVDQGCKNRLALGVAQGREDRQRRHRARCETRPRRQDRVRPESRAPRPDQRVRRGATRPVPRATRPRSPSSPARRSCRSPHHGRGLGGRPFGLASSMVVGGAPRLRKTRVTRSATLGQVSSQVRGELWSSPRNPVTEGRLDLSSSDGEGSPRCPRGPIDDVERAPRRALLRRSGQPARCSGQRSAAG